MGVSLCSPTCSFGPKTKAVIEIYYECKRDGNLLIFTVFHLKSKDKCYSSNFKGGSEGFVNGKKTIEFLCLIIAFPF
jgi:hypothetical protein